MSRSELKDRSGFDRFGLDDSLLRGVRAAGFQSPRPIQSETIHAALNGRDVLGLARTGTGKTAAFALPLLQRLLAKRRKGPRALVLAPTRELATQIADETRTLAKFTKLKMLTVFGGVSQLHQVRVLRHHPDIVIGCPGRVLDLMQQGELQFDGLSTLVLDEADHMFDMGFLPDIRKILAQLPERRQSLLFSATMPREIRRLADSVLHDPHVVELADSAPAETVDHALVLVAEDDKRALLDHVLRSDECQSAIVFTRTKHRVRRLAEQLSRAGHRAIGLQGNMSQPQRDRAMRGFRQRQYDVLVATDIAARGIDVSGISHVINYDVPNTPEAYTHRIGRTGRAELEGIARTFVTREDHAWVRATERMIGEAIPRAEFEAFPSAESLPVTALRANPAREQRGAASQKSKGGPRSRPKSSVRKTRGSGRRGAGRNQPAGTKAGGRRARTGTPR